MCYYPLVYYPWLLLSYSYTFWTFALHCLKFQILIYWNNNKFVSRGHVLTPNVHTNCACSLNELDLWLWLIQLQIGSLVLLLLRNTIKNNIDFLYCFYLSDFLLVFHRHNRLSTGTTNWTSIHVWARWSPWEWSIQRSLNWTLTEMMNVSLLQNYFWFIAKCLQILLLDGEFFYFLILKLLFGFIVSIISFFFTTQYLELISPF